MFAGMLPQALLQLPTNFAKLDSSKRRLLLRAVAAIAAVRLALNLLPFHWLERLLIRRWRAVESSPVAAVADVVWAVQAAARRMPAATCLVQALAALRLLDGAGHDAVLTIGTLRPGQRNLTAHAWVSHHGQVILGGPVEEYTPLAVWRCGRRQATGRGAVAGEREAEHGRAV
jgi:hypothetical protein